MVCVAPIEEFGVESFFGGNGVLLWGGFVPLECWSSGWCGWTVLLLVVRSCGGGGLFGEAADCLAGFAGSFLFLLLALHWWTYILLDCRGYNKQK